MNQALAGATGVLLFANIVYGVSVWTKIDAVPTVQRAQTRPERLAPVNDSTVSQNLTATATAVVSSPAPSPEFWACLKLGNMSAKQMAEALSIFGTSAKARSFQQSGTAPSAKAEVRFGPWAKNDVPKLEKILMPWAGSSVKLCDDKETAEWKNLK